MNVWQFLDHNATGIGFLVFVAILLIRGIYRRHARMVMVKTHGWPPAHLDADGDFKSKEDSQP